MAEPVLFSASEEWLAGIRALNQLAHESGAAVAAFHTLLQDGSDAISCNIGVSGCRNRVLSCDSCRSGGVGCARCDHVAIVLKVIRDRVAYFPLRPADMQTELVKAGLQETLAERLAAVWADNAKSYIARKRRGHPIIQGVGFEVLQEVSSGKERILLDLSLRPTVSLPDPQLRLSLTVESLYSLFCQLEDIQERVDQLCS